MYSGISSGDIKEIAIQLLECNIYSNGNEYSYLRLVYECRKRLNHHSRQSDLAQKYLVEWQKSGETAIEFGRKNAKGLWDYENAFFHYMEVIMKGFENKQVMAKVNDVNPKTPGELYEATSHAEETLNRNLRFGYVQGSVDSRAMVGLNPPGQNVSRMVCRP